ncbi:MAG TPA: hypothetical protein VGM46_08730, partial [Mesorhizobium sp.]
MTSTPAWIASPPEAQKTAQSRNAPARASLPGIAEGGACRFREGAAIVWRRVFSYSGGAPQEGPMLRGLYDWTLSLA